MFKMSLVLSQCCDHIILMCYKIESEKWSRSSGVWLFAIPWTVGYQASPSIRFSRQEYWSGLPFPSPRDLPDTGIKLASPALQVDSLLLKHWGSPSLCFILPQNHLCYIYCSHMLLFKSLCKYYLLLIQEATTTCVWN